MVASCRLFVTVGLILVVVNLHAPSSDAKCVDHVKTCSRVAHQCNDPKVGTTVRRKCRKSCGHCGTKQKIACGVDNPECTYWAANGYCSSKWYTPSQKRQQCPNACHFYRFSCDDYIARHPIVYPNDNFNSFYDLQHKVTDQVEALITDKTPGKVNAVKTMQTYRDKCLDVQSVEKLRTTALWTKMQSIGGGLPMLGNPWNQQAFVLQDVLIKLTEATGTNFMYNFLVERWKDTKTWTLVILAPFIIVNPHDYNNPQSASKIQAMHDFFTEIVGFLATDQKMTLSYQAIEAAVRDTINFEKELITVLLAQGYDNEESWDKAWDKVKFSTLKTTVTQINWDDYVRDNPLFDAQTKKLLGTDPEVYLYNVKILQAVDAFYKAANPKRLSNYLFLQYLLRQVPYLDTRFASAANRFAGALSVTDYKTNRPRDCADQISTHFQYVVDYLYIQKHLSPQTVRTMDKMIEDVRAALAQIFRGEKWLDPTTKANAVKKVKKMKKIIGGVDQAKDPIKLGSLYADLTLDSSESLAEMATKVQIHKKHMEFKQHFDASLGFALLEYSRSFKVNSYHVWFHNTFIMTAAILQPPFFDPKQSAAVNYGAIGFFVGHEMSHGFDARGANFDENGRVANWWQQSTKQKFNDRAKCFINLYSKQREPVTKRFLNGAMTITEDVADGGGIRAAYLAYKRHLNGKKERHVSGYRKYTNEQTFFISYGRLMCSSRSKNIITYYLDYEEHSLDRYRVNLVLANYPEFAKAFKCKKGSIMNPVKRCAVW
ncbi:Neprilysin-1 [Aphelenchoides besseyi]|nr:Neprilysin-1 [Aphelenchoides besseyi]